MAIDQKILDEIETLTAEQLLAELREAKAAGTKLDPRTLKLAMDIIETASGAKAFKAKEEPVILKKKDKPVEVTGEERSSLDAAATDKPAEADDSVPLVLPDFYKTKSMRDRVRRCLPDHLDNRDRKILNAMAEQDGAELLPEPDEKGTS